MAVVVAALSGCEVNDESFVGASSVSWEEFRDASPSFETLTGRHYFVQGDLPIGDEDALFEYFLTVTTDPSEDDEFRSVVNILDDQVTRDRWPFPVSSNLTYCVEKDFNTEEWTNYETPPAAVTPFTIGDPYANAVASMAAATRRWEDAANVTFIHLPAEDDDCSHENPNVVFSVRPWTKGGLAGCAFYPNDDVNKVACDPDLGIVPTVWLGAKAIRDGTDSRTTLHELGHALGMRHERAHPDRDPLVCNPDNDGVGGEVWYREALTEFDYKSTMLVTHGECREPGWDYSQVSPLDGVGIRRVYGMPVAWYVATGAV